jgi:hypothetical protein
MAKLGKIANRDLHDAKAVAGAGQIRAVGEIADHDRESLDRITGELHQCFKNENGIRRRKTKLMGAINALVDRYKREGETFVRYLHKDKVLIFRGSNGEGQSEKG